jgi:hypothetical protein
MAFIPSQPFATVEGMNSDGSAFQAYLQGGTFYSRVSPFATVSVPTGYVDSSAGGPRFASNTQLTLPGGGTITLLGGPLTDSSGTPGNATNNSPRGRAAFAAAGTAVVITSSLVTATSQIVCTLETVDATLTQILTAVPGAGAFTVTGNAAATGTPKFSWMVVNS